MKKTAIIITNYNSVTEVLEYVKKIKTYSIINKIVIIDNASTNDDLKLLEQIESKKVTIIKSNENLGYAKANNLAIKSLKESFDYLQLL